MCRLVCRLIDSSWSSSCYLVHTVWDITEGEAKEEIRSSVHYLLFISTSLSTERTNQLGKVLWASQVMLVVKNSPANARDVKRHEFDPSVGKIPWSRKWQPTPVFSPGKFHGQRSLVCYSPSGCKELDLTQKQA